MPGDGLGDQLLVTAAAVAVRRVEKIDAELARPPDRRDARLRIGLAIERRHRRAAEPDRRYLQCPKPAPLHIPPPQMPARQYDRAQPTPTGRADMPRYQQVDETKLDDAQRRVWNECKSGPRGSVPPPVHVWLKSPGLADHAHKLGAHVRFGTAFSPRLTEIAILVTARYWTAQFEWAAHARLARQAGVAQEVIDAIAERRPPVFSDPDEQLVYDFCSTFYRDHAVDQAVFERVKQ